MIYQTILPEFAPRLILFGALAAIFAMIFIYNLHNYQPLRYRKGTVILCAIISSGFITLFIRVTAPYKYTADILLYVFVLLTAAAAVTGAYSILFYFVEKSEAKAPLQINILHFIDDYVAVFDKDRSLIFSTCPNELDAEICLQREEKSCEFEYQGRYYQVSFSPVMNKDSVVGFVEIISNITMEKNLLMDLSEKIANLNIINQALDKQVNIDDALLIAKHQQQVALEIQENIEQKISELIRMIAQMEKERSRAEQIRNVELLAEKLRLILQDIRKIVYGR